MSVSSTRSEKKYRFYLVRAIYLGSEPMGELLDGENGSDAVQVPLKRTILRTDGMGDEVDLIVTDDGLCVNFVQKESADGRQKTLSLPIETLAYCGALKQLPPERVQDREFETLDKIPGESKLNDPPLFVSIFRCFENENTLLCHSFVIRKDIEAMELVQNVMETYYNVVGQLDHSDTNSVSGDRQHILPRRNEQHATYTTADGKTLTQDELDRLLEAYNRTSSAYEQNTRSILNNAGGPSQFVGGSVSAKDIMNQNLDQAYEVVNGGQTVTNLTDLNIDLSKTNYSDVPLNHDEDPIVIKKKSEEEPLVYKQNVYIRWLQPPTPPPPAPIIIREVPEQQPEPLPPLVVYKQLPREKTPPPLIIREKPPTLTQPTEPLVIERRVPAPEPQPRRVIVEQLPPPPQKPRDIILEKWLPIEPPKRAVVVQKIQPPAISYQNVRQSSYYNPVPHQNYDYVEPHRQVYANRLNSNYEIVEQAGRAPTKRIIRHVIRPIKHGNSYAEPIYDSSQQYRQVMHEQLPPPPHPIYSTHQYVQRQSKPQITGYRIIRQIIPGPNATNADIERALARSQNVDSYARQSRRHSRTGQYTTADINSYDSYGRQRVYSQSPPYVPHGRTNHASQVQQQPSYSSQNYIDPNVYRSSSNE